MPRTLYLKSASPPKKRLKPNSRSPPSSASSKSRSSKSNERIWSPLTGKENIYYPHETLSTLEFRKVTPTTTLYGLSMILSLFLVGIKERTNSLLQIFINFMNSRISDKYDISFLFLYLSYFFFTLIIRYTCRPRCMHSDYVRLYKDYLTHTLKIDISKMNPNFIKLITGKNFQYFTSIFNFDEFDLKRLFFHFAKFIIMCPDFISCDEKLYKSTKKTPNQIYCPRKPARKGIWYFQACCRTRQGVPFLIHTSLRRVIPEDKNATARMILPWIRLQKSLSSLGDTKPILVIDSFYSSTETVKNLVKYGVPFILALRKSVIPKLTSHQLSIASFVKSASSGAPGKSFKRELNSFIVTSGTLDQKNRNKDYYTLTNAFKITKPKKSPYKVNDIKDIYKTHFNSCDAFNGRLSNIHRHFRARRKLKNTEIRIHTAYMLDALPINLYGYTLSMLNRTRREYPRGMFYADMVADLFKFAEYTYLAKRKLKLPANREFKKLIDFFELV